MPHDNVSVLFILTSDQGRRSESKTLDDSKQTGVGRYRASMKKWGLADSAACECGEEVGTGRQCSM